MSTKKKVKQRDNYRCQICGDPHGKKYDSRVIVKIQAHHIIPKFLGGKTIPQNEITLCDLCHAVFHKQRWKEYFGDKGKPENMERIKRNYEQYLKLPYEERERIKAEIWRQFGIS